MQRRAERVEEFLRRLDANGNGAIDADEVSDSQKFFVERMVGSSGEVKYPLAIAEALEAHLTSYRALMPSAGAGGGGGEGGGAASAPTAGAPTSSAAARPAASGAGGAKGGAFAARPEAASGGKTARAPAFGATAAGSSGAASASVPKGLRFLRPGERLPKGLPDWFKPRDANGDGQVSMGEFAAEWTPAKETDFLRLDRNGDGMITPDECLKAEKNAAGRK
jgi:Ca2+-binding EF-hand superfamily protein